MAICFSGGSSRKKLAGVLPASVAQVTETQCAPVRNGLSEELGSIPGQAVDFEFEFHGQML